MKIKSYKVKEGVVKVFTDVGEFAYPVGKFSSVAAIEAEIYRKLKFREEVIKVKKEKLLKLEDDFKIKDIKLKVDDVVVKTEELIVDG